MIRLTLEDGPGRSVSRRELLRLGGVAGLAGLVVPRVEGNDGTRPPGFGRAKSVLVVFTSGGPSQFEMWDPKPGAPEEVRGAFGSIDSAVAGVRLGEYLPELARRADRYTIVRSMSHDDTDHGSATYLALTGRYHSQKSANPPPSPADHPTLGASLRRARPTEHVPYTSVQVNGPLLVPELPSPGLNAGFLGREFDPMVVGDPRGSRPDSGDSDDLPPLRMASRRSLLGSLDSYVRMMSGDRRLEALDGQFRQAYELLDSPEARAAFDLEAEPTALLDRYGRNRAGLACVLARRLVEAEAPLVTVFWNHSARGQDKHKEDVETYGWDTHNDIFSTYRDYLLPRFDHSVSVLLDDLEDRGLMEQTLVIIMGEFGRAPRVAVESRFDGSMPGRKHWANVYSIVMAGAGVSRGAVIGGSDRIGSAPIGERYGPWDVCATILNALGVDPSLEVKDSLGRPFALTTGRVMGAVYGG